MANFNRLLEEYEREDTQRSTQRTFGVCLLILHHSPSNRSFLFQRRHNFKHRLTRGSHAQTTDLLISIAPPEQY